jgi:hypothetical protein
VFFTKKRKNGIKRFIQPRLIESKCIFGRCVWLAESAEYYPASFHPS